VLQIEPRLIVVFVNGKIIEIDPEGRIEFQKEKCEKRVFNRRDDDAFQSKMVAHFSLTIENIKRARENKLEKYLGIVSWESLNARKNSLTSGPSPKICPKTIQISTLYEEFETFIGKIKMS